MCRCRACIGSTSARATPWTTRRSRGWHPGCRAAGCCIFSARPAIDDVFHADRWEYLYSFARGGEGAEWRRITLYFEDDRLVRIEGDVLPADAVILEPEAAKVIRVPPRPPEKGFFRRVLPKAARDK